MVDVAIIGCGVTGAAVAYHLAKKQVSVLILEAENDVSMGTTKANSAILHAGYDPEPGTAMARLNVRGSAMAKEICAALDVPYKQTGSFVVAFGPEQEKTLQRLYENGTANGVPGLKIISGETARELEPNLSPEITAGSPAAGRPRRRIPRSATWSGQAMYQLARSRSTGQVRVQGSAQLRPAMMVSPGPWAGWG